MAREGRSSGRRKPSVDRSEEPTATAKQRSGRRAPKGNKRERTRAALLDAALQLVREKGYERTTLEAVAARAGMTTGAIYGNFKNRDELLVALGDAYWPPVKPDIAPGSTFAEAMQAMARATIAAVEQRKHVAVGRLTGVAYTLQNAELRASVRDFTKSSYTAGAKWLRGFGAKELPMPAAQLVVVIHCLMEGLVMQRILTAELCPDEVFFAAFAALAKR